MTGLGRLFCVSLLTLSATAMASDRFAAVSADLDSQLLAAPDSPALTELLSEVPTTRLYGVNNRISRVYGAVFAVGNSPEESADAFVQLYSEVFGVGADSLQPYSQMIEDGRHTTGVMYNQSTGEYGFTLVYYTQEYNGTPVFRAELRVLVRNEPGFPVVWAGSSLRNLTLTAEPLPPAAPMGMTIPGMGVVAEQFPQLVNMSSAETLVYAGSGDLVAPPAFVDVFTADNGLLGVSSDYASRLFVTDAVTGQILFHENLVLNTDVTGNVAGLSTDLDGAAECGAEVSHGIKYSNVTIGSTTVQTDGNGNFTVPNSGTTSVSVSASLVGKYFNTINSQGASTVLTQTVTPPGPANFVFNATNTSATDLAQVNGYVESNRCRDFAILHNPTFPSVSTQTNFPVYVNVSGSCNAFYSASTINFYRAGGGCGNMAYSNVVHHEYGHNMVEKGGSLQGAYGEGMGDTLGTIIGDQPITGLGFYLNQCTSGIRTAANTKQYPCSGEIHDCGQLISGCVWSTRNQLIVTNPSTYLTILGNLTVDSILLHTGSDTIAPDITVDFLTLDGWDGQNQSSAPHYNEITTGFGAHNMDLPAPIGCADISGLQARCANGKLSVRVNMTDSDHTGQTVTVNVDSTPHTVTISGSRGQITIANQGGTGNRTISLVSPAGCSTSPVTVNCP